MILQSVMDRICTCKMIVLSSYFVSSIILFIIKYRKNINSVMTFDLNSYDIYHGIESGDFDLKVYGK